MEEILSFKLDLLGEFGVGKSSLFYRYILSNNSKFEAIPSVQPQYETKTMLFKDYNKSIKFELWDTAGREQYRALAKVFYKKCNGCLLIYDICDKKSFEELKNYWIPEIRSNHSNFNNIGKNKFIFIYSFK